MKKIIVFEFEESPYHPGQYMIRLHHDRFYCTSTTGSYNVLMARVMGLHYADYLRMCRDLFGANIYGKNNLYPIALFPDKLRAKPLLDNLNAWANLILFDREHPDYKAHERFVKEHDKHIAAVKKEYDAINL